MRLLERQQVTLSQFFSPVVLETLAVEDPDVVDEPLEPLREEPARNVAQAEWRVRSIEPADGRSTQRSAILHDLNGGAVVGQGEVIPSVRIHRL